MFLFTRLWYLGSEYLNDYRSLLSSGVSQSAVIETRNREVYFVDRACCEEIPLGDLFKADAEETQIDRDDDGLSVNDEMRRLTSDCETDSDGDGVIDPEDPAPNRYFSNGLSKVMYRALLRHMESIGRVHDEELVAVFVDAPFRSFSGIGGASPNTQLIVFEDKSLVKTFPEYFEGYSGVYSIKPLFYSPGGRFLVEVGFDRRSTTPGYAYYSGIELPVVGPLILHRSTD